MNDFPTKRDYWYGVIIALLSAIFLVISFVVNPSKVNSELGLASTIASIILSFIAIIYTLVDSSNNKNTSSKIIEASQKISTSTNEINTSTASLTNLTQTLISLNLDKKFLNLENTLGGVEECVTTMNSTFGNDISEIKNSINNLPMTKSNELTSGEIDTDTIKSVAHSLIKRLSEEYYHANEIIYVVYKVKIADKPLFPFFNNYISQNFQYNFEIIGRANCVLGLLTYLYCLRWDDTTLKVVFFDDLFLETVKLFEENNIYKVQIIDDMISKL